MTPSESSHSLNLQDVVLRQAPIVLWTVDSDGIFTLSTGRGLEALGLRPGEAVGLSAFELYAEIPEIIEDIRRALSGEAFDKVIEVGELAFKSHYTPLVDTQGNVEGVMGVSTDITDLKRAERGVQDKNRSLAAIYSVDRATGEELAVDRVLDAGLKAAIAATEVDGGAVYLLDPDEQTLSMRLHQGVSEQAAAALSRVKSGQGITGAAISRRSAVVVQIDEYPIKEFASHLTNEGVQTLVAVPLHTATRMLGALVVGTRKPRAFTPESLEPLESIGLQLGTAIHRAQLHEELGVRVQELTALNTLFQRYLGERDEQLARIKAAAEKLSDTAEYLRGLAGDPPKPGSGPSEEAP